MRFFFLSLFFLLALSAPRLHAQAEEVGFIRFVNAVGLKGKLDIRMKGQSVREGGFVLGSVTGGVGLKQGSYNFSFEHPGCTGLKQTLKIDPQITRTWVIGYEKIEKKDKPDELKIILKPLDTRKADKRSSLDILSASHRPAIRLIPVYNNKKLGKDLFLGPWEKENLPLAGPGNVLLGAGQFKLLSLILEDPGHWAVIVFDDPSVKGGLRAVYFPNEEFQLAG